MLAPANHGRRAFGRTSSSKKRETTVRTAARVSESCIMSADRTWSISRRDIGWIATVVWTTPPFGRSLGRRFAETGLGVLLETLGRAPTKVSASVFATESWTPGRIWVAVLDNRDCSVLAICLAERLKSSAIQASWVMFLSPEICFPISARSSARIGSQSCESKSFRSIK